MVERQIASIIPNIGTVDQVAKNLNQPHHEYQKTKYYTIVILYCKVFI